MLTGPSLDLRRRGLTACRTEWAAPVIGNENTRQVNMFLSLVFLEESAVYVTPRPVVGLCKGLTPTIGPLLRRLALLDRRQGNSRPVLALLIYFGFSVFGSA
jgi:hypothetical protein